MGRFPINCGARGLVGAMGNGYIYKKAIIALILTLSLFELYGLFYEIDVAVELRLEF